jgi:hypothetical protein
VLSRVLLLLQIGTGVGNSMEEKRGGKGNEIGSGSGSRLYSKSYQVALPAVSLRDGRHDAMFSVAVVASCVFGRLPNSKHDITGPSFDRIGPVYHLHIALVLILEGLPGLLFRRIAARSCTQLLSGPYSGADYLGIHDEMVNTKSFGRRETANYAADQSESNEANTCIHVWQSSR